jgi:hypothetical protein
MIRLPRLAIHPVREFGQSSQENPVEPEQESAVKRGFEEKERVNKARARKLFPRRDHLGEESRVEIAGAV